MAIVPSTNRYAKDQLPLLPEGTVIWADHQTEGYGRRGGAWESLPGNLMFSLVLWPYKPLHEIIQLSFVVSLAIGEAISSLLRPGVRLSYKWPNDVLLEGQKVCGILLETELLTQQPYPAVILGIGLNIRSAPCLSKPIAFLNTYAENVMTTESLLTRVLNTFAPLYARWKQEGFTWVQEAWLLKAHLFQQSLIFEEGTRRVKGKFIGIDPAGGIMLQTNDKYNEIFYAGQIVI